MTRILYRVVVLVLFAAVAVGCDGGNKVDKPGSFVAAPGGKPMGGVGKDGKPSGPTAPQVNP